MFEKIRQYFQEVIAELKKTSWPNREATKNKTLLVIVTVAILAVFFGGIDFLLQKIMTTLL